MYELCDYILLSPLEIYKRLPQEKIIEHVLGFTPKINAYIASPFRGDKHPGAYFHWYNGILWFTDFADTSYQNRHPINILMEYKEMSYWEALNYLNTTFSLGLNGGKPSKVINTTKNLLDLTDTYSSTNKGDKQIVFKSRLFEDRDRTYWYSQYNITREQLIQDQVFPIIWYEFYSERTHNWVVIRPDDLCYAYCGFNDGRLKIYRPHARKDAKWLTSCSKNDIGEYNSLVQEGEQLVITKSYKDCRILRSLGINSIWLQNEGVIPDNEYLMDLLFRFKQIIIVFDNDNTGFLSSYKLYFRLEQLRDTYLKQSLIPIQLKVVHLNPCYMLHKIKDVSDLQYNRGESELLNFLTLNNINYVR